MDDILKVNINEYLPLRDVVFNTLRESILKGDLKPGERLMEIQLAQRLGVSRTPIREAIRKLELEGLVIMIPRRGAEVARITEKNTRDVLEVRKALEELAVQLACQRIGDEELLQLEEEAENFHKMADSNNLTALAEADVRFHDVIYLSTGNQRLIHILNNLGEQMYRYRIEYIKDPRNHASIMSEHHEIVEAIKAKDMSRALVAIDMHIDNQEMTVTQSIKDKQ